MKHLSFELITPERPLFSCEAESVVLPAHEGEMGILPGHEPFMVQLRSGELRVRENGQTHFFSISGGFAEVLGSRTSVFAETAEMAAEIDVERARIGAEKARAVIAGSGEGMTLAQAEALLKREAVRLRVAGRVRSPGSRSGGAGT
ncbi:MAG: ATP synthase F1 subunit epsilon [Elusimicrobiota bacterium]|jgi:F-type H+-transporting ATPase subunit epsilon